MNVAAYIPIIVLWIVIFIAFSNRKKRINNIIKKRKIKGNAKMKELAKRFVDKDCLIYTLDNQLQGIIKDVTEGAILLDNAGVTEAINLDFIVRIREYPKNKNGKKKSIVLD